MFMCVCVYLLGHAEDVSVILAKPANPGQSAQRSGQLVTVEGPEVGPSQRKFPPGTNALLKHKTEHKKKRKVFWINLT